MADKTISNYPVLISETNITPQDNRVLFGNNFPRLQHPLQYRDHKPFREVRLRATVGTIQFNVNSLVAVESASITTTDAELVLKLLPDDVLHWKAAAQNDAFIVSG